MMLSLNYINKASIYIPLCYKEQFPSLVCDVLMRYAAEKHIVL